MDIEEFLLAEGRIEHIVSVGAPVAVDIFGAGVAHTCCLVVHHKVADAVARLGEHQGCHHAALLRSIVGIEHGAKVVVPRRLEARVTHGDVQRVAVVHHFEQVGHRGLRSRTAIAQVEVGGLVEAIAETYLGRNVEYLAHHYGVDVLARAFVFQACALRVEIHACIEANGLGVVAQTYVDCVVVILVGGVLTIVEVAHGHQHICLGGKGADDRVVVGVAKGSVLRPKVGIRRIEEGVKIEARAVAVGIFIGVLIAHLGKQVLGDGLGVAYTYVVVPRNGGLGAVLVEKLARTAIPVSNVGDGKVVALALGVASLCAQRNVAALLTDAAHHI